MKPRIFTPEEILQIVFEYQSGEGLNTLAKKYRLGVLTIRTLLLGQDIVLRNTSEYGRTYQINDRFLDTIDTEVKAYYLGFMYADGYNGKGEIIDAKRNRYKVSLALQNQDRHILESFAKALEAEHPIRAAKKNLLEFCFNNLRLASRLAELGCHRAKTFTLTFPEWMPNELLHHFVRGYIDGDGCITFKDNVPQNNQYCNVKATGNTAFIGRLADVLKDYCNVGVSFYPHPRSPGIVDLSVSGRAQVMTVLAWLYRDATICLERKKRKAEQILVPFIKKGTPSGSDSHLAILTEGEVVNIKGRVLAGERFTEIAKRFGVEETCIRDIAAGRTWGHVTGWNSQTNVSPGNPKGSRHGRSKLTEDQVRDIKQSILLGETNSNIARKFSVSERAIYSIAVGKNWTHITI
ncbi:hypothetical protein [Fibrella forsythiae]|uniref:DOD-type homing endonuclease domain-containing protein n=1 Tax=Fibrella forsythiae TaxID=2817061 RepID=A0ABS3JBZ1_9BACT|nr:hypothetical protein [Fibrella forsythiae]MBO0947510.1 hypothetical protein [Fibrella forsythiae]